MFILTRTRNINWLEHIQQERRDLHTKLDDNGHSCTMDVKEKTLDSSIDKVSLFHIFLKHKAEPYSHS
jgi:hypothetical protein